METTGLQYRHSKIQERCMGVTIQFLRVLAGAALVGGLGIGCYAQTANRILDRYIRAAGGPSALSQVHTEVLEGDLVRLADGRSGSYTAIIKTPNLFFSEITLGSEHTSEAFNGKSAWRRDESENVTTLTGDEAALLESVAVSQNARFLKYTSKSRSQAKVAGQELVQGHPAFRVEFLTQGKAKRTVFFDAQSYLVVKEKTEVEERSEETSYSQYQSVDGVMEPFRIDLKERGEAYLISNIHVRHNAPVENATFDFPVSSKAVLPDISRLLAEIQENQRTIEAVLENYTYLKTEEETDVDDQYRVTGRHQAEYEVFYVEGREIEKLRSKDGVGLNSTDQQKEDGRTEKLVTKYQQDARAGSGRANNSEKDNEDELHVSVFLRACKFTNPRRESLRGQELIVFDIEPNPGYRPRNMNERLARQLEGVMWVDERAHQVVRLEAGLGDSAKMGWGILGTVNKGSAAIFEQTLVNNEVWLPSYAEIHLAGHYLFFSKYKENLVIHYGDYKKFRVETIEVQEPPKPNEP